MKTLHLFLAFTAFLLVVACGDETSNKNDIDNAAHDDAVTVDDAAVVPDEGGDEAPDEDLTGPLEEHLAGVWAMKLELYADGTVPVVGDILTRTDKIIRMEIKEKGEGKVTADWQHAEVCHMETVVTEGNDIAKTITTYFPPTFTNTFFYVPPTELAEPKEQTVISGTPAEFSFAMNKWYEMRGAYFQGENDTEPFDIETEMITDKEDTRIFDHDGDDRPGHTFEINSTIANGLVWGVIKNVMEITSISGAGKRVEGTVQWAEEEIVIDTDQPIFEGERIVTARKSGNTMVMVKIDGSKTCDDIMDEQETLFNP